MSNLIIPNWMNNCRLKKRDLTRSNDPSLYYYEWDNYTLKRDGKMLVPNGALSGHLVCMTGKGAYGVIDTDLRCAKQVRGILEATRDPVHGDLIYSVLSGRMVVEVSVYETHDMVKGGPMEYRPGDVLYPSCRGLLTKGVGMTVEIDSIGVVLDTSKKECGSLVVDLYL